MNPAVPFFRIAFYALCVSQHPTPPPPPNFAPALFTISPGYYSRPAFRLSHSHRSWNTLVTTQPPPRSLAQPLFLISPGYYSRPRSEAKMKTMAIVILRVSLDCK